MEKENKMRFPSPRLENSQANIVNNDLENEGKDRLEFIIENLDKTRKSCLFKERCILIGIAFLIEGIFLLIDL